MLSVLRMNRFLLVGCGVLIFLASTYSQPNQGTYGLSVPFNVTVWLSICLMVIVGFGFAIYKQRLNIHYSTVFISLFLIAILTIGSIKAEFGNVLLSNVAAFTGVIFLLVALNQFYIRKVHIHQFLIVAVLAGLVHSLIGLVQIHDSNQFVFKQLFEFAAISVYKPIPTGSIQQANMFGSFVAFAMISLFYLYLNYCAKSNVSKFFNTNNILISLVVAILTVLFSYILIKTNSRAASLGLVVGFIFLVLHYFSQRKKVIKSLTIILFSIVLGVLLSALSNNNQATSGVSAVDKFVKMSEQSEIRGWMYKYGLEAFLSEPLVGHGIGNIREVWRGTSGYEELLSNNPSVVRGLTHPHNEVLFWMMNSGVVALVGFVLLATLFIRSVVKNNKKLFILALISPLVVQAMVSRPFELSALHLLLIIFLIHYGLRGDFSCYRYKWNNRYIAVLSTPIFISLIVFAIYSAWHTLQSQYEVMIFKYHLEHNDARYSQMAETYQINHVFLDRAKNHPFYEGFAISGMNKLIAKAIVSNNRHDVEQYILWASSKSSYFNNPEIVFNLIKSYLALGEYAKALSIYESKKYQFADDLGFKRLGVWIGTNIKQKSQ